MTASTAVRSPTSRARTTPLGTGHLHQALEDARDLASLQQFCSAHVCTPAEVSSDGKRLDMLRVFDLMRSRGYQVSPPARSQHQPKKGFTAWLVDVVLPGAGVRLTLRFYTSIHP
jgi:hypothetical protein